MGVAQIWNLERAFSTEFLSGSRFNLYQNPLEYVLKTQTLGPHLITISERWSVGDSREAPFLINLRGESYRH